MGIVARIPRRMFREIEEIQNKYRMSGTYITFTQAASIWYKRVKGLDKIKKKWKFPEFV